MPRETKPPPQVRLEVTASKYAIFDSLIELIESPKFDHGWWSNWDAERLESAAKRIREAHAKEEAERP